MRQTRTITYAQAATTSTRARASRLAGSPYPSQSPIATHGENDSGVEELAVPLRPRLEIAAALAPDEEQEERDREEERDLQDPADRRDDRLEREHDDDDRDHRDDPEPPGERRDAVPEPPHDPVMNARTASPPATSVVAANQRRRRGPTPGA